MTYHDAQQSTMAGCTANRNKQTLAPSDTECHLNFAQVFRIELDITYNRHCYSDMRKGLGRLRITEAVTWHPFMLIHAVWGMLVEQLLVTSFVSLTEANFQVVCKCQNKHS